MRYYFRTDFDVEQSRKKNYVSYLPFSKSNTIPYMMLDCLLSTESIRAWRPFSATLSPNVETDGRAFLTMYWPPHLRFFVVMLFTNKCQTTS